MLLIAAWLIVPASVLFAQELSVPVRVHFPLLTKLLNVERAITKRVADEHIKEFRIGIVYQSQTRISNAIRRDVEVVLKENEFKILQLPVKAVYIDLSENPNLWQHPGAKECQALYVAPLRSIDIPELCRVAWARNIITLSGVTEYVQQGVVAGIEDFDGHSRLLINLTSARRHGVDFPSKVLKLARVVE